MATEAANAAIRYAFGHLGAKAISIGYFDRNEPSRRIVEKLGFQKLRVAHNAATRCLDGTKLDRHEYMLTSPDTLPELDVSLRSSTLVSTHSLAVSYSMPTYDIDLGVNR
jgi:Acetyltransferase (GNAT) domain